MVSLSGLRVVFMGTPGFAVPALEALIASRHHVVAVITQPDRPRGRGQATTAGPVKALASAAAIPVLQPESLKTPAVLDAFTQIGADLGVVVAYGRILPEAVLTVPRLGMVNVHASLLPSYRGAAPVHRAVLAGEMETGVTIMRVVKALDAGPMLARRRRPIGLDETSADVERDLARIGSALLVETVDRLELGGIAEEPQNEAAATYAPRIVREEGLIDWTRPAIAVHNQVRGLHPWPHAYTFSGATRLIVLRTRPGASDPSHAPPGTIVRAHAGDLMVASGDGLVQILSVQAEGGRAMQAREFLAGHHLAQGVRLSGPP